MSTIFGLDGRTIESEVVRAGVDVNDIDATIVTHLHFDHAGGLTRRAREGEEADWVASKPGAASGDCNDVKFTFPNAELITQRREWVDARNNDSVMTRTYYRDHLLPFEDERMPLSDGRPRLRLIDSARPFPLNRKPSRNELPKNTLDERMTEVLPGIRVFLVPGHTWGQQAIQFEDEQGRTITFTSDVMPTHYHIGQPYSLGYDVEPYTSMVTKHWFLKEASERDWILVLDHDPGNPCFRVKTNDKGWFDLVEEDCGILKRNPSRRTNRTPNPVRPRLLLTLINSEPMLLLRRQRRSPPNRRRNHSLSVLRPLFRVFPRGTSSGIGFVR